MCQFELHKYTKLMCNFKPNAALCYVIMLHEKFSSPDDVISLAHRHRGY